jgi:hypothetical protein
MSSRQSAAALKDWLLGTQAAPACEAGAFIRDGLATAHRSLLWGVETMPRDIWMIKREVAGDARGTSSTHSVKLLIRW